MAVKRKAIFKKAAKQMNYQKKFLNLKARLDGLKPQRPGNGMINLDPREWNGGFDQQPPAQQFEDIYRKRAAMQDPSVNAMQSKLQALLQQRQFQKPQPGPGDGMISLDPREWNGGFDQQQPPAQFQDAYKGFQQASPPQPLSQIPDGMSEHFADMKDKFAGGLPQLPQLPGPAGMNRNRLIEKLRPTQPGRGMISLDPREWNGGFNKPQTPVKMPGMPGGGQRPMPMPGLNNPGMRPPAPMPGLGGGMPLQPPQGPKQMPMPNPRRNLIPRPIDPRYKLM